MKTTKQAAPKTVAPAFTPEHVRAKTHLLLAPRPGNDQPATGSATFTPTVNMEEVVVCIASTTDYTTRRHALPAARAVWRTLRQLGWTLVR
jgi:hypothetical protein